MDKTVSDPNFAGMAVFTPVINGEVSASAARAGKERAGSEGLGALYQSGFYQARESSSESSRLGLVPGTGA